MTPLLDKPYAMFGHCLGGLTIYETACQLRRVAEKLPIHMFACGSRSSDLIDKEEPFERLLRDRLLSNTINRDIADHHRSRSFDRPSDNPRSQAEASAAASGLNVRANSDARREVATDR
jgi:hypothetical protein